MRTIILGGTVALMVACGGTGTIATSGDASVGGAGGDANVPPTTVVASAHKYDVVANYHASGMATLTTGTISSGTNSLVVTNASTFSVGQGVFVAGAVAASTPNPSGNLITSITAIAGTTFTLAANATVSVTKARVQHDDTAAINSAIADAFNNGGGLIWITASGVDGIYRCSGLANNTTGGILTFPQNINYVSVVTVSLLGEVQGKLAQDGQSVVAGGVSLDFHDAPNVSGSSAIAAAPFVAVQNGGGNYPAVFNALNVEIDDMMLFLPRQTKLNGLLFSNAMQARVGDHISLVPQPDSSGMWLQPKGGSVGIWMPQQYNNVFLNLGSAEVFSFNVCLVPGDHLRLGKPYLTTCNVPIYIYNSFALITGDVTIENAPMWIQVDRGATRAPVNLTVDSESWGSGWAARGPYEIVDTNNTLTGSIRYKLFAPGNGPNNYEFINRNGGGQVALDNLAKSALYSASGTPLPACNASLKDTNLIVSDATGPTYLATYASGGSVTSPVLCNGTTWVTY